MSVPIAEIFELSGPARSQEASANVAITPRFQSQDEDCQREHGEQESEGEEEEAEGGWNGFQTQTRLK